MQILGRGDNPKAFIRHGQREASTEITLSSGNPGRPVVIRRLLKQDGSNEWRINGAGFSRFCNRKSHQPGLMC